jgi:hypothetical protein
MCLLGFCTLIGGLIATYTKTLIEIAKIQVQIKHFEHDLVEKEKAILKLETRNTFEHDQIVEKLDKLIDRL